MLVKSFEEVCEIKCIDPKEFEKGFQFLPEEHRSGICALSKLVLITDELNTNEDGTVWSPDFSDNTQYKYELYFTMGSPSGVGLSCDGYVIWATCSYVGSRLVFKDKKTAIHAKEYFFDLFKEWMVYERKSVKQ